MEALVVTTEHRGVFFGYGELKDTYLKERIILLERARMCIYWITETRGVLGLAATGPQKGCRITAAVPKILLNGVTAVMVASEEAQRAWELAPWAS